MMGIYGLKKNKMELKDIHEFMESEIKRLDELYKDKDKKELVMAHGFKVVEELGELFEQLLTYKGYQRKDKLDKLDEEEIKKEFVDVIFTVLLLAKRFDINIEEAIEIKMNEIKKKDYN